MAGILTRGEIVAAALQWGGNPSLTTRANEFLNLYHDHLCRSRDWEFLRKEASISSGSPVYTGALPADYGKLLAFHIDNEPTPMQQVQGFADLWQKIRYDASQSTLTTSAPTHFAIDVANSKVWVWPVPDAAWTGDILYYKVPAEMTVDADVPDFPDSLALVKAVTTYVESYERESLQILIERTTDETLRGYAAATEDIGRVGGLTVQMDPAVFRWGSYRES
jgi:hypothetical protein